MSFLQAGALALGALVVVPLLIHLRRRETSRRIPFPALRYLARAEDARSRSLRASDVLLLLTRLGLLIALALAAAGPLLGRGGAADHEPADVAILIDNSASAGRLAEGRPLLEMFVDRARQTLAAAQPEDRFWIQPLLGAPLAAGVNASRALDAIDRVVASRGGGDLTEALARATALLPASSGRRREIQLLSDLQRSAFRGADDRGTGVSGPGAPPLVAYVPPRLPVENGAIASVDLSGGSTVPGGFGHAAIARVERPGGPDSAEEPPDSVPVPEATLRVELDGQTAGGARAPWGSTIPLGLPELAPGVHEGRVMIEPDGLRADDERHFAIQVIEPPAVERSGPPGSFLAVGIETLRQAGRLGSGPANVQVIEGMPGARLPGTGQTLVLVPPLDPVELPAFSQLLARSETGWTALIDPRQGDIRLAEGGSPLSLPEITIHRRYLLRATEGTAADTTLLRTDDDEPWLVRSHAGGRTFLILGSALDPLATDLPASPAMIPFMEALLVRWSHLAAWPASDFEAGLPFPLPEWADSVRTPAGEWSDVEPGAPFTALETGVFRVSGAGRATERVERGAAFAVNVPARESDLRSLPADSIAELFPGREVTTAGPGEASWEGAIFRARRGRDLGIWLLLLALGLAATELVLATPGRTANSR
jgi:hypothetical protein